MRRAMLREVLTIRGQTVTDLGGGAVEVADADLGTVRGRVKPLKGYEAMQARQVVGGTPYHVTIDRKLPDGVTLSGDSRIVWQAATGNVTLHLTSPPAMTEDRRYYTFLAVEKEVT